MQSFFKVLFFMASVLLLSACDQQDESGRVSVDGSQTNMSFTAPTQLLTSRSIVRANLILEITIDGKTSIVEPNADGVYEFKTVRPANSSTFVTLLWSELINGELLPLARATKLLNVGSASSPAELLFSSSEFDTSSDDKDQDGFSNYIERRDGLDVAFDDPNSPVSPPVLVPLDVQLALPVGMRDATAEQRSAVTAQALVNSAEILLSREGDVWRGSTTVTQNSEPLVTVNFFATDDRKITIASRARNQNIGGGGQSIFNENDYEVDSFNDDGDSFNNIRETAIGSNPRDSNDPRAPVANAGIDQNIANGAAATLNGSGSSSDSEGTITNYQWSEGTQQVGTGVSPVISGLIAGPHVIDLLVTDNLGLTDTDSVTITVAAAVIPNKPPKADAGPDDKIDSGASVTLDGSASSDEDGTIATFQWSEGGVPLGTGERPVISGLSDGVHVITLLVTDNDGDTDTNTVTIEVEAAKNKSPKADAGSDDKIDSGASVTLDGSASSDEDGTIATFQWSEGGVPLGTGERPVISSLSDGVHVITLLVTDNDGATDTDSVSIEVEAAKNKAPKADAGPDDEIDSGASVTLDGSASSDEDGNIATFEWSEGTTELGTGEKPVITGLSDGVHVITLLVTDDDGDTDTDSVSIEVIAAVVPTNERPVADAGPDDEIVSGASVTLDGSASNDEDGTIATFEWSEGRTELGTGEKPVITGLSDGVHVITLLVTDDDAATDTDSVSIEVMEAEEPENVLPTANAGPDIEIDSGASVTLDGSASDDEDGTIATFEWTEGTTELGTGEKPVITGLSDGVHVITLLVTDDDGDTDTDSVSVEVMEAEEPENVLPVAKAGPDIEIDSGASVTLDGSDSTDRDGTIATFEWSEGTTELGTGEKPVISGLSDGVHVIDLLVTDDKGGEGTDSVTVTVKAVDEFQADSGTQLAQTLRY